MTGVIRATAVITALGLDHAVVVNQGGPAGPTYHIRWGCAAAQP